jgi:CubicO group peptidase (beta-lactamase class C family)
MHCNKDGKNAEKEMPGDSVFENIPETHYLGGGGLVSTLEDYGNFAKMLLNKGLSHTGKRILSEETFLKMTEPQIKINDNQSWGLGVRVITKKTYPHLPVGCFGWSGAYGTHFFVDPENGIVAVFMKNSAVDGGAGNESAVKFEKAVYSLFI